MITGFETVVQKAFGVQLTPKQVRNLTGYVSLLRDWSVRVRLISKGDRDSIWERHIIDCLAAVPSLPSTGTLLDFGSGAGLPGIPLAIVLPQIQVHLLEPARMKALFLNQVVKDLGLSNVTVLRARSEELIQDDDFREKYDYIIARAVSALPNLWNMASPLLSPSGELVALKGPNVDEELIGLPQEDLHRDIRSYTLPLAHRERTLVTLRHVSRETF